MLRQFRQHSAPSIFSASSSRNNGGAKRNGGIEPRVCLDAKRHPNRPGQQ
jgi:hypothetical protein